MAEAKTKQALIDCVAQVSHDIRSPLAALNTAIRELPNIPENQRVLIRNATQRITDIANNLLSKYREKDSKENELCTSNSELPLESELLSSLLETLCSEKKIQIHDLPIDLRLEIEDQAFGIFVQINVIQMKRVLSNLINNALEAMEEGGKITVKLVRNIDRAVISIADSGKGIDPTLLERLKKGGISYGKKTGTGVGISSAIADIERWHGTFELRSELGAGTTAYIDLPITSLPAWFQEEITLVPDMTVVILDDDASIHAVWTSRCQSILTNNVTLKHLYDGKALRAYSQAHGKSQTIFLVDYELLNAPESGLDLIEELALNDCAVLVTSRYEEQAVREHAQRLNVRIIPKSFSPYIPIKVLNHSTAQCVFLDDEEVLTEAWKYAAELKGIELITVHRSADLKKILPTLKKDTPIYIDSNIGESVTGEQFAKELHEQGFKELYLASGYPRGHFGDLPWIKKFVSKAPPF